MSALYPGQRVRVVRDVHNGFAVPLDVVGSEGVIETGVHVFPSLAFGDFTGHRVRLLTGPYARESVLCLPCELEPILPDGLESNEEIDALYEPQPIEIRA